MSEVECGKILAFHEKGHLKHEITQQSQLAQQSYKLIYSQPRWTHNDATCVVVDLKISKIVR